MEIVLIIATILVGLGWIGFTVGIGFSVAASAGTVAGVICVVLLFLLMISFFILDLYGVSGGCLTTFILLVWLIWSGISTKILLALVMTAGWAAFLSFMLVVVWIVLVLVCLAIKQNM